MLTCTNIYSTEELLEFLEGQYSLKGTRSADFSRTTNGRNSNRQEDSYNQNMTQTSPDDQKVGRMNNGSQNKPRDVDSKNAPRFNQEDNKIYSWRERNNNPVNLCFDTTGEIKTTTVIHDSDEKQEGDS